MGWLRERPKLLWGTQNRYVSYFCSLRFGTWSQKVQLCSAQFRSRTFHNSHPPPDLPCSEALQDLRHPPAGKVPRAAGGAVEICRAAVHLGDDDLIGRAGYNGDVPSGKRLRNYGLRDL